MHVVEYRGKPINKVEQVTRRKEYIKLFQSIISVSKARLYMNLPVLGTKDFTIDTNRRYTSGYSSLILEASVTKEDIK
jgi:hypothetical protein